MPNVNFVLEAEEAKAVQAFLKVVDAQNKAETQFKKTTAAGKQQANLLDQTSLTAGQFATRFLSVAAAVDQVTRALRFMNAEREQASSRLVASEFSLGQLSQLAGGDANKMRQLVESAKKTVKEGGIPLNEAAALQFNLESFGVADQRKLFADLIGTVQDPSALAESSVTLQSAFTEKETGSIRQIINKGLAASAVSKTTLNSLLTNAAQIAPGIAEIGGTDEEALAALAVLSKARRSPDQAATEIQALSKVLLRQGLGGVGLFQGIEQIGPQISGLTDADKLKFFGDIEGFKAYSSLTKSKQELERAYRSTDLGNVVGSNDQVAGAITARRSIPEIASSELLRKTQQTSQQLAADKLGVGENQSQQIIENIKTASLQSGESGFQRFFRVQAAEIAKFLGAGDRTIATVAATAGSGIGGTPVGVETDSAVEFLALLRELNTNIQKISGSTNSTPSLNMGVTE